MKAKCCREMKGTLGTFVSDCKTISRQCVTNTYFMFKFTSEVWTQYKAAAPIIRKKYILGYY